MITEPGTHLRLLIEKPAAGGRMIARADGQIVLVGGAIPGERITARVDRVAKGVAYAETIDVDSPSDDRRPDPPDPLCGGCLYAHIAYPRQLALKSLVIADAFARIGRIVLPGPVAVAPSPEDGYRMRARLHVRNGRLGFFREGTHDICDARATRQLLPASCDALDRLAAALRSLDLHAVTEVELSENVDASERVVHFDSAERVDGRIIEKLTSLEGLTRGPFVTDTVSLGDRSMTLRRHVLAFFQGNRFLLNALVAHVVGEIPAGAAAFDLYAGAGLFAVGAAIARSSRVTAVEGDRYAAADLAANSSGVPNVTAIHEPVERFVVRRQSNRVDTIIVDPPRVGLSREAADGIIRIAAPRIVYVSCDVATLARDARRLLEAGYELRKVDAFDLFPNTPHVETVTVFERNG